MPMYSYKAKDKSGKLVSGTIESDSERSLRAKLREMGYFVTDVSIAGGSGMNLDLGKFMERFAKVQEQSLVIFSRMFATMIGAGMPMVRCLDILATQTEDVALKPILTNVRKDVEGGATLGTALGRYPKIFSVLFVNMIKAGELGGILDTVLNRLAEFLEKDFNLKKKVKSASSYPMTIGAMAVLIVAFLVAFILPTFTKMFIDMHLKLPLPTKILIAFTDGCRNPFVIGPVILMIVGGIILFNKFYATAKGRLAIDGLKMKAPVFGLLIRKVAISRFCRTLGTLLNAGVPIMQALDIVGKASGNEVVAMTVLRIKESVKEGESITKQMSQSDIFPPLVTQMVAVGEETGNLDGMLGKISDFYDTEVEHMLNSLTAMLEPMMIGFMGLIVGFIVVSVFLPLYQIIGSIGAK